MIVKSTQDEERLLQMKAFIIATAEIDNLNTFISAPARNIEMASMRDRSMAWATWRSTWSLWAILCSSKESTGAQDGITLYSALHQELALSRILPHEYSLVQCGEARRIVDSYRLLWFFALELTMIDSWPSRDREMLARRKMQNGVSGTIYRRWWRSLDLNSIAGMHTTCLTLCMHSSTKWLRAIASIISLCNIFDKVNVLYIVTKRIYRYLKTFQIAIKKKIALNSWKDGELSIG